MESQQRINLRWPLGDDSFVAFELYVADGSLPLDCFEQLGRVVEEIEDLVDLVAAPEAEVICPAAEEFNRRVSLHDDLFDDTPGMAELKAEAAEAVRRLVEQGDVRLRDDGEPPRFKIGDRVRQRSLPEREGRVVGVRQNGSAVSVEPLDGSDATMSGWWPVRLVELAPKKAPARKPLKVGQTVQHRDHVGCIGTVLELGGTDRRGYVLVESTSSLAPADGWWSIDNALPYSGVF